MNINNKGNLMNNRFKSLFMDKLKNQPLSNKSATLKA